MSKLITSSNLYAYHTELAEHIKLLQRGITYSLNNIVNYDGKTLKCTTAGTTATTKPNVSALDVGDTYTDGTCVWTRIDPDKRGIDYWASSTTYALNDQVVNDNKIYKCSTAHTSTSTFDATKWTEISAGGGGISIWQVNTDYEVNDVVIDSNLIWKCVVSHTSTTTFDESKWVCISGGEISNGLEIVPLWQGEAGDLYSNGSTIIELSEDINLYQKIGLTIKTRPGNEVAVYYREFDVENYIKFIDGLLSANSLGFYGGFGNYTDYIEITPVSTNNQLSIAYGKSAIIGIIGIRKAKPIVSSGMKYETLWEGEAGSFGDNDTASISLLDPIIKYQKIGIEVTCRHDSTQYRNYYREIDVASFVNFLINHQSNETFSITWGLDSKFDYVDFNYSSTTIQLEANLCRSQVKKVIGISEGVQIPTGVQAARVTLWEGQYNTVNNSLQISDSIENYDQFEITFSNENLDERGTFICNTSDIIYNRYANFRIFNGHNDAMHYTVSFHFIDSTHVKLDTLEATTWSTCYLIKITGIKYIQPDSYSTEEKLIGTWIDGKPLYRKVFENPTNGMNTGLTSDLVSIHRVYGFGHDTVSPEYKLNLPHCDGTYTYSCNINVSTGTLTISLQPSAFTVTTEWLAVEYTKN